METSPKPGNGSRCLRADAKEAAKEGTNETVTDDIEPACTKKERMRSLNLSYFDSPIRYLSTTLLCQTLEPVIG